MELELKVSGSKILLQVVVNRNPILKHIIGELCMPAQSSR